MPEEKETFDLKFEKCGVCGSEETLLEKARGGMKAGEKQLPLHTSVTPLVERHHLLLSVPVLVCIYDACANCGTYRVVRAAKTKMVATAQMPKFPGT